MSVHAPPSSTLPVHPLHSLLLAFPVALFPGTFAADVTYARTAEIQWSNFAQWLNAGGLVFGVLAGIAAVAAYVTKRRSDGSRSGLAYVGLLGGAWLTSLVGAFIHSRDAWSMMPDALWWSGASAVLVLLAAWIAWSGHASGGPV